MIRQLLFGRIASYALIAIVVLSIWQSKNGDPVAIANEIWRLLEGGARIVATLWHNVMAARDGAAAAKP